MKKILSYLLLACSVSACIDFDDTTPPITVGIELQQPQTFSQGTDLAGQTVTLSGTRSTLRAVSDGSGKAVFSEIAPDVYTVSAAWDITTAEYLRCTSAQPVADAAEGFLTIAGSLAAQPIMASTTLQLALRPVAQNDIVISKIYYAGSKDNNGRGYAMGYYMEIFNQSDQTVDMGGLYIGMLETESTQAYTLENLHEHHADSVVLLKQVFRVPRHARSLVPAGGTLLLVNSAIDHSKGNSMEHSLLGADFEAKDDRGLITNNPDVPALEQVFCSYENMPYINFTKGGPCGIVIFKTDDDLSSWPLTYKYPNTATSDRQWLLLPRRHIIDGVDVLKYNQATQGPSATTKRLYADIDATYAYIATSAGNTGEVIYRKTSGKRSAAGHILLQDTNNSLEDFQVSTTIKPREYDDAAAGSTDN